jgi:hypothetical protein
MTRQSSLSLLPPSTAISFLSQYQVKILTDNDNHAVDPTFLEAASCLIRSYTDRICGVAGSVFGRAWAAPISAFKDAESFDMTKTLLVVFVLNLRRSHALLDIQEA